MKQLMACATCGATMPPNEALASACPRCLLSLALDPGFPASLDSVTSRHDETLETSSGLRIGRFRILRQIGAGGMGAVYEAQQDHPRRTVALKLFKSALSNLELLRRFEFESQALGRLQHPGIAQIYEAGTADTGFGPQAYFAMEFIQGENLSEYVERHRSTMRQRLEIVARVCEAVHHAHQRGLIHRDLKPANILIDEMGQAKILDFGVARVTNCDTHTTLQTSTGQLVGTLAYMSPEQALADPLELDTRSDVYALGVILYELLSGRLPYSLGKTIPEGLRRIREEDPAPLGSIDRRHRGDIETIVAKALEKDKTRRYSSAAELGADIQRHLRDEPIIARPPSATYHLQKFARRHRGLVAGAAAVFVTLTVGVVTSTWQAMRAAEERDRATAAEAATSMQRDVAVRAMEEASVARNQAAAAEMQAVRDRDRVTWQFLARESMRLSTARYDDELAALLARQSFLIQSRTPAQPRYLVEEALQQAARLNPWNRRITVHDGIVHAVAFSADSGQLASGSADGTARVWNLADLKAAPIVLSNVAGAVNTVAFSPDGKYLVSGTQNNPVKLWRIREPGATPLSPSGFEAGPIFSTLFSPDGTLLAICSYTGVWIWDLNASDLPPRKLPGMKLPPGSVRPCTSMALSSGGFHLAAGDLFGEVRVWDLRNPDSSVTFQAHAARVNSVAFSPDGTHLASSGQAAEDAFGPRRGPGFELGSGQGPDWSIRLWDLGKPDVPPVLFSAQESQANSIAFSPDGNRLASAGDDGDLRIWDLRQPAGRPLRFHAHEGGARSIAFSGDGHWLATAGRDYSVRVWDLRQTGLPLRLPRAHEMSVESLAFSPNNAYLASGSTDHTVRLLKLQDLTLLPVSLQHEDTARPVVFSPDGAQLASVNPGSLRVWDVGHLESPAIVLRDRNGIQSVAFSQNGTALASLSITNPLVLNSLNQRGSSTVMAQPPAMKRWEIRGNDVPQTILQDKQLRADTVAFTEDWSRFASAHEDNSIHVWNLRRPTEPSTRFEGSKNIVTAVALSRGGALLAAASLDLSIRVWDLEKSGAPLWVFRGRGTFVSFSLDDTRLVAGGLDTDVRMWDLLQRQDPPVVFHAGTAAIRSIALARDGRYMALGDADGNVWLYPVWSAAADYLCTRVSRNLSLEEWHFYVGESIPYERTCKALPAGAGA